MSAPLLSRHAPHRRTRPSLRFLGDLALERGRAHEICGDARRTLAAMVTARTEGPVCWIVPAWAPERLNPEAVRNFFDPGRLLCLEPRRQEDLLWCLEEVLRTGTLAVAELPEPPGLTAVRRLHLAAEAAGAAAPLGLLLTPGDGGAPGVESRWRMAAAHGATARGWRLDRLRARTAPVAAWQVRPGGGGFRAEPQAAAV